MHLMRAREILERDYEVVLAKSGTSALNQLRRTKADVILVDIEMPDMSGFDFIRKAREAMPGIIDTPMLFVTSHATREFIMEANEVGVADYILKPYTPNNLCSKIRIALKNRRA
ncbi:hypothetical protein FACS1894133_6910 [Clostridia bacterium]|nr:hypothetical protein FACS1894133_6910 [Clostridia bacterium]